MKSFFRDRIALSFAAIGLLVALLPFFPDFLGTGVLGVLGEAVFAAVFPSQFLTVPVLYYPYHTLRMSENLEILLFLSVVYFSAPFSYFLVGKVVSLLRRRLTREEGSRAARVLNNCKATAGHFMLLESATLVLANYLDPMRHLAGYPIVSLFQFGAFFMLGNMIANFSLSSVACSSNSPASSEPSQDPAPAATCEKE